MKDLTPVIRKLSKAQSAALLKLPRNREFIPSNTEFQWPTLANLKHLRLINSVKGGLEGMGKDAKHVVSPLGHRVIAELEKPS